MKKIGALAIICLMILVGTLTGLSSQVKSAVVPMPDLVIDRAWKSEAGNNAGAGGKEITVKAIVRNKGDAAYNVDVRPKTLFFLDSLDNCKGEDWLPFSMAPGETVEQKKSFYCPSGDHTVIIWADYYDIVDERDENNNVYYLSVHINS
jgi:hypothetical protein